MFVFTFKTKINFGHGYVIPREFTLWIIFQPWNKQSHHFSQIKHKGNWQQCVCVSLSIDSLITTIGGVWFWFHGENRSPASEALVWTDVTSARMRWKRDRKAGGVRGIRPSKRPNKFTISQSGIWTRLTSLLRMRGTAFWKKESSQVQGIFILDSQDLSIVCGNKG